MLPAVASCLFNYFGCSFWHLGKCNLWYFNLVQVQYSSDFRVHSEILTCCSYLARVCLCIGVIVYLLGVKTTNQTFGPIINNLFIDCGRILTNDTSLASSQVYS